MDRKVILVHHLDHVRLVLQAAQTAQLPAAMQSAPGAADYAGSQYFLAMMKLATHHRPAPATFTLDCGHNAALAITAMKDGHTHILCEPEEALRPALQAMAQQYNVQLQKRETAALDLLCCRDPLAQSLEWIKKRPD